MSSEIPTPFARAAAAVDPMDSAPVADVTQVSTEPLPQDDGMEADSAEGEVSSDYASDTTSVASAIYRGYVENGRRYATGTKSSQYWVPSDAQQFECLEAGHICFKILDCQEENDLFRSPIGDSPKNILDLGAGDGSWAIDVADRYPNATVTGVDLYPPPQSYVPPNCDLEVDDVSKPWTWNKKFDFIHLRLMIGSFSDADWEVVYKQSYDNLEPGGWIEHVDTKVGVYCSDSTMPADSLLAKMGPILEACAERRGIPMDTTDKMRSRIESAGFINVQEKNYKVPLGSWPRHPIYKDAGRIGMHTYQSGLEGFSMFLLTQFGDPKWTKEEVEGYLTKIRKDLDSRWHIYQNMKRIWAQKPY